MNYRHAFHAGNFADVLKHAVLARVLMHLAEKPAAFRVLDTHAGAGLYDLAGPEASRTGEWRDGIGRVLAVKDMPQTIAALLAPYLDALAACGGGGSQNGIPSRYPGSPLIAARLMRPQDRLVACELEPGAAGALARALGRDARAKRIAIDGWLALKAYLPPKERRGLVLIDPPFEKPDEFARLSKAVAGAVRKWPSGVYMIWHPVKNRRESEAFLQTLADACIPKVMRLEISVGGEADGLTTSGLVLINPPWRLADELTPLLDWLVPLLARGPGAAARLDWIAKD
ncbi:Protein involved in catabolism of external DNA [Rhodovulum sp. PH10]|uniref:23S rRNA (adenine(2030)-N(6))-methyltransferase RlmJ n=1 Tax=Rhodovulum sp. PH10 TaxID=1187851 RepID=UPI00027C2C7D|nr:23S rRNA (adenine(2030)-N(6))-methyltransferase RlmJ [Rhodovulum sp. PH10]EJW10605.1 Protein involved in catabolism of external DNA [Rhodovulum sp. PH10]